MQSQLHSSPLRSRALHGFAVFTACCTFLLIIAGALVTGNDAGLAVPDWPLSYGSFTPPWVGGIRYEHGHRMVAMFVGFLTTVLAFWLSRRETRQPVRRLGCLALEVVITQGILGGLTVLFFLPAPISILHATLAQTFFCLMASLAWITGPGWAGDLWQQSGSLFKALRPSNFAVTSAFYALLFLGVLLRQSVYQEAIRSVVVVLVAGLVLWTVARIGVALAWVAAGSRNERIAPREGRDKVPLRSLVLLTTTSVYLQLILGAALRHSKTGLLWHIFGALIVTFLAIWTLARAYKYYADVASLFRPAMILGILLATQLSLGVGSYVVRLATREDVQPGALAVAVTTAHVATGAAVLVTSLLLTLQCRSLLIPAKAKLRMTSVPREATS